MPPNPGCLASFLRTRRDFVKPADVGLPGGHRRRVAGLRREEVAILAGISVEYYLRLEQGRETQPSDQVLEGLARALQLNEDAVVYMRNLARPAPRRRGRGRLPAERLDPHIQRMIDGLALTPAYVQGRRMSVLGANPLACAVSPFFAPGVRLFRDTFLEPELQRFVRNWDEVTAVLVAWLRFVLGAETADCELLTLIGELMVASPRFRTLWPRCDVKQKTTGLGLFDHPKVGPLDLYYRTLVVPESRQVLVTYHAEPGSPSEERLRLLSTVVHPSARRPAASVLDQSELKQGIVQAAHSQAL